MVVDEVEDDRDALQVGEIDQAFELVHAGPKRGEGQRLGAERGERRVDLLQIPGEIRVVARLVALLGREIVDAIVSFAELGREFLDRQELNGVDAEVVEIVEPGRDVEKAAAARGAGVGARRGRPPTRSPHAAGR